jgi:zinc transport system substrate-binding protein
MWKSFLAAGALALNLAQPAFAQPDASGASPSVVVSIKPLHGLVAAVMRGVGEPALIVSGNASPHTYALKPSDARALQQAKLVVWVGKDFESFLTRTLDRRTDTLAMEGVAGMTLLPTREGGVWEEESDPHHHDHGEHGEVDGHLWLDPDNAARLVSAVATRLEELDPAHAATYAANAADTQRRLGELDAEMAAELKPLAGRSYVVFHDAYHYLEHRYGLTPAGSITVDPERPPSARRMAALRDRLKAGGATCVFREPQFAGATVQALADSAGARVALLDPEGTIVTPGPDTYFTVMRAIAQSLSECLSGR